MLKEAMRMNFVRTIVKLGSLASGAAVLAAFAMAPASAGADVTGVVKLDGEAPKRSVIKMDADANCVKIHGDKKVGTEDVIVSKDGQVKDVFVYVSKGLEGKKFDPPAEAATIDQRGCMYIPHVQGIMVKQTLNIVNSDATLHNIHALAKENPEFNFGQPQPGTREKVFQKVETPIHFKCDVHPWMSAFVFVLDHPHFAVSERDGGFTIKGLPDGDYTLTAWHEKFGTLEQAIKVAGGSATAEFTFKAK
jgi:hypothetical protein